MLKKQGPLPQILYKVLSGDAYTAAKAANINKTDLANKGGAELLVGALRNAIRGSGPTRVGEIFDKFL